MSDWIKQRFEQQRRLPDVSKQLSEEWLKVQKAIEHCRLAYNEDSDAACNPPGIKRGELILTVMCEHPRTVKVKHTNDAAAGELRITVTWDDGKSIPLKLKVPRPAESEVLTVEKVAELILDPLFFPEFARYAE